MRSSLSLIVPAHNASDFIERSLDEYVDLFKKYNLELIVVCNACNDNTAEICRDYKNFPIKVIETSKRGKGRALNMGFNQAKGEIMGFIDADSPFDLQRLSRMIEYIDGSDVVIGTKFLKGKFKAQDSPIRRIISLLGSSFSKIFFNMHFRDTQAGAKFFKRHVWQKVSKRFISTGFEWDIEFLYECKKNKFRICEYYLPVKKYEKFSTFRIKFIPGMVKRLLKVRFLK